LAKQADQELTQNHQDVDSEDSATPTRDSDVAQSREGERYVAKTSGESEGSPLELSNRADGDRNRLGDQDGDEGSDDKSDDETRDVYGLLRSIKEDTDDPLDLEDKDDELLFGLEDRPYDAALKAEKAKREPPPPPVVGVRMDYGAPAYAPLTTLGGTSTVPPWAANAEMSDAGRPLGLTGPFTLQAEQEAREAQRLAWFNAVQGNAEQESALGLESPLAGASSREGAGSSTGPVTLAAFAANSAPAQNQLASPATSSKDEDKAAAQSAKTGDRLEFGLSEKTRVQLGTTPPGSSAVRTGSTDNAFAPSFGPNTGSDRFRLPTNEVGPFGSLGSVSKVISAYLQQASASRTDADAGRTLSTVG
jgi:hypothetical protein